MIETLSRHFEEQGAQLPNAGETRAARTAALARFQAQGFPNRKIETWHYTDLGVLAGRELALVPPEPGSALLRRAKELLGSLDLPHDEPRAVFVDGRLAASLSRTKAPGLTITSLNEQPLALLAEPGIAADAPLASLNTAFAVDGAVIRVAAGDTAAQGDANVIHLVFLGSAGPMAPQVRVRVELEPQAKAAIVQHFADLPGAEADDEGSAAWLNLVTDVALGAGSFLELYRLQAHGPSQYQTSLTRAELAREAKLVSGSLELGGRLVRNELEIALAGDGAQADLFGLAVARDRQHVDSRLAVDHRAPATISRQEYRAIAADRSRSVFNGKVTVREHAQGVDARQRNDNLLLSPQAEVDTKPELEIYADQVACSHGATVGELSEEQMFYLRARGIGEAAARGILTAAFAERIVRRFGSEWLQDRARALARTRLPTASAAEEQTT